MVKFCCTLPNCNRRFATDRSLYQHKKQDPKHNRKKSYDSYIKVGKKRYFPIQYEEGSKNTDSYLRKKTTSEPNNIDADIMSNIVEEDDKSSYEDLEEIANENALLLVYGVNSSIFRVIKVNTVSYMDKLNSVFRPKFAVYGKIYGGFVCGV